jgi:hypothetical protein
MPSGSDRRTRDDVKESLDPVQEVWRVLIAAEVEKKLVDALAR